ncbi:hypothetical protein DICPUDRAFT_81652 [Dictyostelium purpureum]|uniref:EGF-like domain-containing protein n=1 Tax=Dictyostelium purpureum TaxID=5786 RepID=F0ZU61_DICPU|nr:uncharacterized protein DICPUDRAFT_81652 [Dictyostelium purpureum]EGC32513.1 hypothetical protein DICPUDRAFT_81652 [Dictyostelium purpureum]|eukprot:XP_003290963.1 hypothetical protein DICPUDRAFT_81652 [Dictyostelium purpureum]
MNSLQERLNIVKYAITISNILVLRILKPDKRIIDWCQIKYNILSSESNQNNKSSIKVNFTQNTIAWSGNIYPYYTTEKECSSKYHEHGICDKTTGTCKCNSEYTGFDCSSPINNNNNNNQAETETETNNNGTVIIKNHFIGYSISIQL